MTERGEVRYGDATIGYSVVRSARRKKTIEITLDATDGVLVAAPVAASADFIHGVVAKRASWILSRAGGVLEPKPKLFVSGETLPYLGREVRMDVTDAEIAAVRIRFNHWSFEVNVPSGLDGEERRRMVRAAFIRWYRRRAADAVRRTAAIWAPRMGVTPKRIVVRDQRQRWGSCSADGTIRINWRMAMAEPALLDYVVVHELAHLAHRNHSRDFWRAVEAAIPDCGSRRRQLKEIGPQLSM